MGWYTCGTQIGPALGPLLMGAIVTTSDWRNIFWMQAGLCGFGTILAILFIPETIPIKGTSKLKSNSNNRFFEVLRLLSPLRMLALFQQVRLVLVGLASSALVCNMYSLLTPIAYVINPRLNLTSPLLFGPRSGLCRWYVLWWKLVRLYGQEVDSEAKWRKKAAGQTEKCCGCLGCCIPYMHASLWLVS